MSQPELLLIVHRIPFPPNKGDKIRSFHILEHLSKHYRVHLATFIDDPQDCQYISKLDEYCESTCIVTINPLAGKIKSLFGLFKREPLSVSFYSNKKTQNYVQQLISQGVEKAVIFSSAMAQFVFDGDQKIHWVADLVDVDSDKWQQYASNRSGIMKLVYQREASLLLSWEKRVCEQAAASLLVSENERALMSSLVPEQENKIYSVPNGVDSIFFSQDESFSRPFASGAPTLVFTGAMDYWANVDAVTWFVQEVLPFVWEDVSDVQFWIVGSNPTAQVKALADDQRVFVTGRVPDVRPYLQFSNLCVAPLRIARGIQNKVLEAMAMKKAVVATHPAMNGLVTADLFDPLVSDDPMQMANTIKALLDGDETQVWGERGREYIEAQYDWGQNLEKMTDLIEGATVHDE